MYEVQTFETILSRMLSKIPGTVDKREGSIIWDTLAPAAMELEKAYQELDYTIAQQNPKTADMEHLEAFADTYDLHPYEATKAILEAELETEPQTRIVPNGTRFRWGELTYVVTAHIERFRYSIECETPGEIGNRAYGKIYPVMNVNGLKSARIVGIRIPGTDRESFEDFLERVLEHFKEKAFGGNRAQYKEWLGALQGVGGAKIFRHYNGQDFYVEVVIIDSRDLKPTQDTIDAVQEAIHPLITHYDNLKDTLEHSGEGLAPIGHVVFVHPVEELTLNLTLHVDFKLLNTWERLQDKIKEAIEAYLAGLRHDWEDNDRTIVRISGIETAILNVEGVEDVQDTLINGQGSNLIVGERQIPILGEVTNAV